MLQLIKICRTQVLQAPFQLIAGSGDRANDCPPQKRSRLPLINLIYNHIDGTSSVYCTALLEVNMKFFRKKIETQNPIAPSKISQSVEALRALNFSGGITSEVIVSPGVRISFDSSINISGGYKSTPGMLIDLSYRSEAKLEWAAMHFSLGSVDFSKVQLLGVAIRGRADKSLICKIALRSYGISGFVDSFFEKTAVLYSEETTHLDHMRLESKDGKVPLPMSNRDLVIFMPDTSSDLRIEDIVIFSC